MNTPYGKAVKKMRIDNGLKLKDMADALGYKSAYLSAVELGKKRVTDQLIVKTVEFFGQFPDVSSAELDLLAELSESSQPEISIELYGKSDFDRSLIASFARKFPNLDDEKKAALKEFLEN